jgi:hypothetical protein
VWAVVSDVRRTGEWSPECRRVVPAGRWLIGFNRRNRVRWATVSRIEKREPNRVISWDVKTNRARWTYLLKPADGGTTLEHTRETPRGVGTVASWFTRAFLDGERAHDDELETGMASGLQRIKTIVESTGR